MGRKQEVDQLDVERRRAVDRLEVVIDEAEAAMKTREIPLLDAISKILDLMDQQARLLGLYHPEKIEIVDPRVVEAVLKARERRMADETL